MKTITRLILILVFVQGGKSFCQMSFQEWEQESKTNKRLLPKYGNLPKSPGEIESDTAFIKEILSQPEFKTRREASNHLIDLGFKYYYRPDFKTAMYRFNQAYLLDSTNSDVFWGYGAIYMAFGQYNLAKEQYEEGLRIDRNNKHLMTDLATYHLEQFYGISAMPSNKMVKDPKLAAKPHLDSALIWLIKSYQNDPKDVNTAYKLSICYWNQNDCTNAWKYFDVCKSLGGDPITPDYEADLNRRCPRK